MTAAEGVALGTLLSVIIGAVVAGAVKIISTKHDNSESTSKRSLDEAFRLLEVKDREGEEHRQEMHDLRDKMQELMNHKAKCEADLARALEREKDKDRRLEAIETVLVKHGFSLPVIEATGGSKGHSVPNKLRRRRPDEEEGS